MLVVIVMCVVVIMQRAIVFLTRVIILGDGRRTNDDPGPAHRMGGRSPCEYGTNKVIALGLCRP